MSDAEKSFYNRYWGKEGTRSADAPVHVQSDGVAFLKRFDRYYRGGGGRAVLDVGCGEGDFLEQVRTTCGFEKAFGVDVSDHVIGIARGKHPNIEFHAAAADRLPLPDGSFDLVQSISVLEHLLDLDGALREVARVLKPGGVFVCYTTDFNWLKQAIIGALFWDRYFDPRSPHVRYLKRASLNRLLADAGLREEYYAWNGSYFGLMPQGMFHVSRKR